jgi:hypothetical protein
MKKALVTAAGLLAGATMLMCTAPAMAHGRVGVAISVGLPVAPIVYAAPPPVYLAPPLYAPPPVVVGAYGPVVQVGWPYYYGHRHYVYRGGHRGHR